MPRGKKPRPPTVEPDPLPDPVKWSKKLLVYLETPKNRARTAIIVVGVFIVLAMLSVLF